MSYKNYPHVHLNNDTDSIYSVRRWLHEQFPSIPILLERDKGNFVRPSFLLTFSATSTLSKKLTPQIWEATKYFDIRYFSSNKNNCESVASQIEFDLETKRKVIPHFLTNFKFPKPTLREVSAQGTMLSGTYFIRIEGVSILDDISCASEAVSVNISSGSSIKILIPSVTGGADWFYKYRIFLGTTANNCKLVNEIADNENTLITEYEITNNTTMDVNPKEEGELYYRFLRTKLMDKNYLQDITEESVWDANMRLETCMTNLIPKEQFASIKAINQKMVL